MTNNSNTNIVEKFKTLYENKKYDEAIELLKSNQSSFDSGVYFYNLGISSFAKEDYVSTRIYLEKAKKNGYQDMNSESILDETMGRLSVTYLEQTDNQLEYLQKTLSSTDLSIFVTFSLIFALFVFVKKFSTSARVIFLILCFLPLTTYYIFTAGHNEVISKKDKIVFRGPSKMFEEVQEIPSGMKVIIKESFEGWRRVVYPISHRGWILEGDMESL